MSSSLDRAYYVNIGRIADSSEKIVRLLENMSRQNMSGQKKLDISLFATTLMTACRHYFSELMQVLSETNEADTSIIKSIIEFARNTESAYNILVENTEYRPIPIFLKKTETVEKYLNGLYD